MRRNLSEEKLRGPPASKVIDLINGMAKKFWF